MSKKTASFKEFLMALGDEDVPVETKKKLKKKSDKTLKKGLLKYLLQANAGN
jgi:hypothetical protein